MNLIYEQNCQYFDPLTEVHPYDANELIQPGHLMNIRKLLHHLVERLSVQEILQTTVQHLRKQKNN